MKLRLTEEGKKRLREIREDITVEGKSETCPGWCAFMVGKVPRRLQNESGVPCFNYKVCKVIFPKVCVNTGCPCNQYTACYLLQKIDVILRDEETV